MMRIRARQSNSHLIIYKTIVSYQYVRFQYTIGKGIMLSSTAHNPVREQIKDTASKLLNDEDQVTTLERKFAVVRM